MCLHTKDIQVKTAKEDIECYKVVNKLSNETFRSFFRDFIYNLGITYETFLEKNPREFCNHFIVHDGFHSFINLDEAFMERSYLTIYRRYESSIVIVKCIIPKGSQYLVGTDDNDKACFVSNRIRIIEKF